MCFRGLVLYSTFLGNLAFLYCESWQLYRRGIHRNGEVDKNIAKFNNRDVLEQTNDMLLISPYRESSLDVKILTGDFALFGAVHGSVICFDAFR